jgi:hypothetical protein
MAMNPLMTIRFCYCCNTMVAANGIDRCGVTNQSLMGQQALRRQSQRWPDTGSRLDVWSRPATGLMQQIVVERVYVTTCRRGMWF